MSPSRPVATPFETERLRLRELVHDDAAFVLEMVNDPAWLTNVGDRRVRSLDDACRYIDRVREGSYERHGFGLWLVEPRAGGEPVGVAGMLQRVVLPCPDIGFAFLTRHRGHGYAREAVAGTLRVANAVYGVTRVAAIVGAGHASSKRVVEGNGFVHQADFRWAETGETLALYERDLP
jgi:RimJ/RimL family protein N-acetyltransferase